MELNNKWVICGFSGIGKSTVANISNAVVDLESSPYSHIYENGNSVGRNNEFPVNCIDKAVDYIENSDKKYILLSCHLEVREELRRRGISYIIVMPTRDQRNAYLRRWLNRGSSSDFITQMNTNWDSNITSCENDKAPKIYLEKGEYLSDVIKELGE